MALFNFICRQKHRITAKKNCNILLLQKVHTIVINERDYIKTDDDNWVQKTTSKTENLSLLKRFDKAEE
jgi:hypothetical protein